MANELKQKARELLAAELERNGYGEILYAVRNGWKLPGLPECALRAIAAALQQAQQSTNGAGQAVAWRYVLPPEEGCTEWVAGAWRDLAPAHKESIAAYARRGARIEYAYSGAPPPPLPEVSEAVNAMHDARECLALATTDPTHERLRGIGARLRSAAEALESYRGRLAARIGGA